MLCVIEPDRLNKIDAADFASRIMGLPSVAYLLKLDCVGRDTEEIPQVSQLDKSGIFDDYVTFDTSTRKFTVIKAFSAEIHAWVRTYQTYYSSKSEGAFYVNSTRVAYYEAAGYEQGSIGEVYTTYSFKVNDQFWVYTPSSRGYPEQHLQMWIKGAGEIYQSPVECVYCTPGNADSYTYTVQEDGLYLAVAVRAQSVGCSISVSSGVTPIASLTSNTFTKAILANFAVGDTVTFGLTNSTHTNGGFFIKINANVNNVYFSSSDDNTGDRTYSNKGTSQDVVTILFGSGTFKHYTWEKECRAYLRNPKNGWAYVMYGVDEDMPSLVVNGGYEMHILLNKA